MFFSSEHVICKHDKISEFDDYIKKKKLLYRGFVDPKKIEDFFDRRDVFTKAGKSASFKGALKEIDEYIKNPNVMNIHFLIAIITIQ